MTISVEMMTSGEDFQSCAERLRALADADRLRIVLFLFEGQRNVSEIAEAMGNDVAKVSHHLGVLRHAQIVLTERQGRFINYRLHPDVVLRPAKGKVARAIELGCCRIDLSGR